MAGEPLPQLVAMDAFLPACRSAHFQCQRCGAAQHAVHEGGRVEEPEVCRNCQAKWSCTLIHNLSDFTNKQMVKMQVGEAGSKGIVGFL